MAGRFRVVRVRSKPEPQPSKKFAPPTVKRWTASVDLSGQDCKKFTVVKEGDIVVDYRDVKISGYLSTFVGTTPADRDGDWVKPGAFAQTIPKFMQNPVLLVNHRNSVDSLVGRFTKMKEDSKGLWFEAELSNSPSECCRDARFKVAEGHLRTCSMGGRFHYSEGQREIFKVDLLEGSLTPVPANPDAIYDVREVESSAN